MVDFYCCNVGENRVVTEVKCQAMILYKKRNGFSVVCPDVLTVRKIWGNI